MPKYNLIKYSSNYSETTASLWFYSKDEATNFDSNVANATITIPLKYLSNFWRSVEMQLINYKIELKIK